MEETLTGKSFCEQRSVEDFVDIKIFEINKKTMMFSLL